MYGPKSTKQRHKTGYPLSLTLLNLGSIKDNEHSIADFYYIFSLNQTMKLEPIQCKFEQYFYIDKKICFYWSPVKDNVVILSVFLSKSFEFSESLCLLFMRIRLCRI